MWKAMGQDTPAPGGNLSGRPRKGEIDPEDSVFTVVIFPLDVEGVESRPYLASIWLGLGEAKAAAERYSTQGHPHFDKGFQCVKVLEMATGRLLPDGDTHDFYRGYVPPAVPVIEDALSARIRELEAKIAHLELLGKLSEQAQTSTWTPPEKMAVDESVLVTVGSNQK